MNRAELLNNIKRKQTPVAPEPEPEHPIEKFYRVDYVAARLGISPAMVRKTFGKHPAARFIGSEGTAERRRYTTLLIPESALVAFAAGSEL